VGVRGGGVEFERVVVGVDALGPAEFYPAELRSEQELQSLLDRGAPLVLYDPDDIVGGRDFENVRVLRDEGELLDWMESEGDATPIRERRASLFAIFGAGAIAISAMILPGVSGSFLLLFLGQYQAVFNTLHRCIGHIGSLFGREPDLLTQISGRGAMSDFAFIGAFLVGVGVGLVVFSRVVSWLLHRAHDVSMAALTGVMLGALRIPGGVVMNSIPDGDARGYWGVVSIAAMVGAALVLGLHFADVQLRKRRIVPPGD